MITFKTMRYLKFRSPDGGEGGSPTATVDRPKVINPPQLGSAGADKGPQLEDAGTIFRRSIDEQNKINQPGDDKPAATPPTDKPKEDKPAEPPADDKSGDKGKAKGKAAAKPSALDAALENAAPKADENKAAGEGDDNWLADIPETLPEDKKGDNWKNARGIIERQGALITELRGKVTAGSQPNDALVSENKQLKESLDSYKDAITALNVEYDPDHRKKFIDGRADLVKKAAGKFAVFGGKSDLLAETLQQPESRQRNVAVNELLSNLEDEGERARIRDFINQIDHLDDERAEIQKNPQQAWEKLKATETERQRNEAQQQERAKKAVFDSTMAKIGERIMLLRSVSNDVEGAKEWNARNAEIHDEAWKALGNDISPEDRVVNAALAKAAPHMEKLLMESRKELQAMRVRLAEYESGEPGFRGGKQPPKGELDEKLAKSPGQLYQESMASSRES